MSRSRALSKSDEPDDTEYMPLSLDVEAGVQQRGACGVRDPFDGKIR